MALYAAIKLEAFLRGCAHTANRIGLLIGASPIDALKALARGDALIAAAAARSADGGAVDADVRRSFVRTSVVRELVRYMVSDDYAKALVAAE